MKKKPFISMLLLISVSFCLGCTIHFKAKEIETDIKPVEGKIGNLPETNDTYYLTHADLF